METEETFFTNQNAFYELCGVMVCGPTGHREFSIADRPKIGNDALPTSIPTAHGPKGKVRGVLHWRRFPQMTSPGRTCFVYKLAAVSLDPLIGL